MGQTSYPVAWLASYSRHRDRAFRDVLIYSPQIWFCNPSCWTLLTRRGDPASRAGSDVNLSAKSRKPLFSFRADLLVLLLDITVMAGDIVNLQQYDTSDIERLSRTLPRPQLPTDRKTVLAGSVTVPRHSDACTTTRFSLSITPVIHPPHTHFECECLSIESCCNDNLSQDQLVNEVTSKVQRLLDVEFPQVICDVREIQRYGSVV